ncbi:MAG: YegS/Rv2252/BmrU family lipid kinase [Clostridiales bacterium]|jgi:YegS/Rv2252/BmrU family lipid kinase|nr:YegS/Rv2252/BmrU family lipid kinase [Clostridiales bacterium]
MKKLKLLYNPASGDRTFKNALDAYIAAFQQVGYEVHLYRSAAAGDVSRHIAAMPRDFYNAIAISGGDGTLNQALNALISHNHDIPLAIIPSGTANDFAGFVGMTKSPEAIAEALSESEIVRADIGLANDVYFINVCGAGLFTHISQQVDDVLKTTLGKLAYYLKSLEEIPNFQPISVRITNSHTTIEEDIFLFLTLNSAGTGGFDRLVPAASITDGLLDFIAFRACPILDLGRLFIKIMRQDYLTDPGVIYFQDSYVKVELLSPAGKYNICDIDGEWGPKLPVEIRNIPKKIPLIVPPTSIL